MNLKRTLACMVMGTFFSAICVASALGFRELYWLFFLPEHEDTIWTPLFLVFGALDMTMLTVVCAVLIVGILNWACRVLAGGESDESKGIDET